MVRCRLFAMFPHAELASFKLLVSSEVCMRLSWKGLDVCSHSVMRPSGKTPSVGHCQHSVNSARVSALLIYGSIFHLPCVLVEVVARPAHRCRTPLTLGQCKCAQSPSNQCSLLPHVSTIAFVWYQRTSCHLRTQKRQGIAYAGRQDISWSS